MAYYWRHRMRTHGEMVAEKRERGLPIHPELNHLVPTDVNLELLLIKEGTHEIVGQLGMTISADRWIDDNLSFLSLDDSVSFEELYRRLDMESLPPEVGALVNQTKGRAVLVAHASGIKQWEFGASPERRRSIREDDASMLIPELERQRKEWKEYAAKKKAS